MKLFLASQAKHPKTIKNIENFVNGFKGKKIAYIPTAANAEEGYGIWKTGGSWKTVNSLGSDVKAIVLEEFRNESVIEILINSDIIWVGGGYWGYLMYWFRLCGIDKALPEMLEKGIIYIGSSAGANICSRTLEIAKIHHDGGEPGAEIFPGLGLIDFDIYPHYQPKYHDRINSMYKGNRLYLLEDGESVEVSNSNIKVNGVEKLIIN